MVKKDPLKPNPFSNQNALLRNTDLAIFVRLKTRHAYTYPKQTRKGLQRANSHEFERDIVRVTWNLHTKKPNQKRMGLDMLECTVCARLQHASAGKYMWTRNGDLGEGKSKGAQRAKKKCTTRWNIFQCARCKIWPLSQTRRNAFGTFSTFVFRNFGENSLASPVAHRYMELWSFFINFPKLLFIYEPNYNQCELECHHFWL